MDTPNTDEAKRNNEFQLNLKHPMAGASGVLDITLCVWIKCVPIRCYMSGTDVGARDCRTMYGYV